MLVPGIGKKTAIRLLVELKSRLDLDFDGADLRLVTEARRGSRSADGHASPAATRADVRTALAGLGYGADEIRHALAQLPADGSIEDHIRLALRELAAAR